ncbi:hypothetical protein MOP88_12285 [Sphingomonas sp. WKB10]|nr:hypothetical protein [Sphingomonas sp. WKB10]
MTRPFRILARAIDRDDTVAALSGGPRELREAAAAIASMRNRLGIEAAERARMLTAIAHDLRTPSPAYACVSRPRPSRSDRAWSPMSTACRR